MYKSYQTTALGLCSVALLVFTGLPAGAQMSHGVSSADRAFMAQASEGNLGEIAAGMLAQQRGSSRTVQMLGKRYVDNHRTNERNLRRLAARLGVDLPMHPSAAGRMEMQQLQGLSGRAFDAAFLRDEMRDHMQTIAAFRPETRSGENPAVIAYARQSLPVLEEHLDLATDDATRMRGTAGMRGGMMSGSNGMRTMNGSNDMNGTNGMNGSNGMNRMNGSNDMHGMNGMNGSNGMNRSNANQETGANTAPGPQNASTAPRSNQNQETGQSVAPGPRPITNGSTNGAGYNERTGQSTATPLPGTNR